MDRRDNSSPSPPQKRPRTSTPLKPLSDSAIERQLELFDSSFESGSSEEDSDVSIIDLEDTLYIFEEENIEDIALTPPSAAPTSCK